MTTPTTTRSNPWIGGLYAATALAALAGLIMTTSNADPAEETYNPAAAALGPALITAAGALLAGLLVAGAICWQLRHRD